MKGIMDDPDIQRISKGQPNPKDPQADIREAISEILVKWHMPTRQAAINEILTLFQDQQQQLLNELLEDLPVKYDTRLTSVGNGLEHDVGYNHAIENVTEIIKLKQLNRGK